jgi:hypothetical protein
MARALPADLMAERLVPLPARALPAIHLTGIGREDGRVGTTPVEVVRTVLGIGFSSVTRVVASSVKLVGVAVKTVGG